MTFPSVQEVNISSVNSDDAEICIPHPQYQKNSFRIPLEKIREESRGDKKHSPSLFTHTIPIHGRVENRPLSPSPSRSLSSQPTTTSTSPDSSLLTSPKTRAPPPSALSFLSMGSTPRATSPADEPTDDEFLRHLNGDVPSLSLKMSRMASSNRVQNLIDLYEALGSERTGYRDFTSSFRTTMEPSYSGGIRKVVIPPLFTASTTLPSPYDSTGGNMKISSSEALSGCLTARVARMLHRPDVVQEPMIRIENAASQNDFYEFAENECGLRLTPDLVDEYIRVIVVYKTAVRSANLWIQVQTGHIVLAFGRKKLGCLHIREISAIEVTDHEKKAEPPTVGLFSLKSFSADSKVRSPGTAQTSRTRQALASLTRGLTMRSHRGNGRSSSSLVKQTSLPNSPQSNDFSSTRRQPGPSSASSTLISSHPREGVIKSRKSRETASKPSSTAARALSGSMFDAPPLNLSCPKATKTTSGFRGGNLCPSGESLANAIKTLNECRWRLHFHIEERSIPLIVAFQSDAARLGVLERLEAVKRFFALASSPQEENSTSPTMSQVVV